MPSALDLTPRVAPGTLIAKPGGEIPFERVLLELRTGGEAPAGGLPLKLEARQGRDVICELDKALEGSSCNLSIGIRACASSWSSWDLRPSRLLPRGATRKESLSTLNQLPPRDRTPRSKPLYREPITNCL